MTTRSRAIQPLWRRFQVKYASVIRSSGNDLLRDFGHVAEGKGVGYSVDRAAVVTRDVPATVRGDPGRVRQVLTNLIGDTGDGKLAAVGSAVEDEAVVEPVVAPHLSVDSEVGVGRLLLVEDSGINQKVVVSMLSSAGYLVDTVADGAAAVQAAAAFSYDAILMDCQMPGLSGYEATAAIRLHEGAGRHTPIIALTAGARPEDRQRCLVSGMDHCLSKPVSKDVLLTLVAESVMNGPALAKSVDQFVQETEPRLAELRSAMDAGDAVSVGTIAQSIRTSGGQLGGRRLALSCSRLERKAASGCLPDGPTELREVEFDYEELCRTMTEHLSARPNKVD